MVEKFLPHSGNRIRARMWEEAKYYVNHNYFEEMIYILQIVSNIS